MAQRTTEEVLAELGIKRDPAEEARRKAAYASSDYKMQLAVMAMGDFAPITLNTCPEFLVKDIQSSIDTMRLAERDAGVEFPPNAVQIVLNVVLR